jgi:hypothetical protein
MTPGDLAIWAQGLRHRTVASISRGVRCRDGHRRKLAEHGAAPLNGGMSGAAADRLFDTPPGLSDVPPVRLLRTRVGRAQPWQNPWAGWVGSMVVGRGSPYQ